jgi:PAS domain S-box-containing protein
MLTTWFQRMDSQKDLVSRKEQFELAVRGSNDGIWDWDLQSNALFLSTRWKGMLGYSDDELKNEFATFQSLLHDEDTLGVMEYVRRYLEGEIGTYDTEFRLRHKDGTYRWIRARGEALRGPDGKPYRMAGSHTDITQEKNSALRLAEREEQFRIIFHSSPQPMALTEAHTGKLIEVNDVFCEKLQAPRSKILGRTTTELGFYTPADREVFTSRLLAEGSVKGLEMDFTTPEGKTITAKMFATFVTVNSRKYVLTIFDDITEQKRAETELIAAKQAAEAASRAKSEFLSNMSHEIRTPLNGVIGFSSLLQQTALQPVQMQYVENITSSAHLLLGIINDILDFSKIEAGKLELELVKTDLIALLQQSVDIIKFPAERKGLEVLLDIEPHLPRFARVDPIRLKQVLANLLGNAIKFTAKGEVALKVRCSRSDSGQATLYFTIRDTGIGIPRHRQKRLFKAFSQADSSTTRQFGGTGLGLIISDMLTKKMGGTIELSSRPGKGTVFSFCIETVVECGNGRASSHIEEVKRCLVVDDNEHSRQILEHMLGAWGIECTGCDNGLESLKILEHNEPFDALIVDYHMPYLDGLETIRMIRRKLHLSPAEQPVILLHSSTEDAAFIEACEELGIRFRLTKPVKSQELFNYLHGLGADTEETKSAGNDARAMWQGNGAGLDKRRATILIAEDNATNLLLAQAMIRQILPSARLVEARDGREAIERIRQSRPDIIIMDVQMPVMDGNEATIAIRQAERTTGRHVPIIGLTAGATKSERKKSLRCGMDEYLTKPIETDGLRALVHKYLTSPSHRPEQNGDTDTDANHFDRVTLAKVLNDEELFRRLCHDARADISAKLTALRTALSDEALEEMERIAHSLKGVSLNMRFGRLASHAQTIREHIRGGQRRDVEITMAEMEEEWDTVLSLLDGDT